MPTYEYECQNCKKRHTAVRTVASRKDGPLCCSAPAEQRIFHSPPATYRQFEPYRCVATGQTITSRRQRNQVMKENDLVDMREFGEPDWDQVADERTQFHKEANAPLPQDLQDAVKREGLDSIL